MKILALETTEKFGSAALLDGNQVLAEIVLPQDRPRDRRSSQTLHPALQTLFEDASIAPTEIDLVAVIAGPGSFTGLRVGITAAKVFAYSVGAKIIALDTFQTVAAAIPPGRGQVMSVGVDAQRGDVVAAVLQQTRAGSIAIIQEATLMPLEDWWRYADQFDDVLFTGPAFERWSDKVPPHITVAEKSYWFPKASAAGMLAAERAISGQFDDIMSLLPIYSRLSAAEEKRRCKT